MATGWAKDGAVQDEIDDTIKDAVTSARANIPTGESPTHRAECGEPIPERRRQAVPSARLCIPCQSERDSSPAHSP